MKLRSIVINLSLCLGLVSASLTASAIENGPHTNYMPHGQRIGVRPPALREEHIPPPRAGHVWAPGYWGWSGGVHVWIGGRWEVERPGFRYIGPRWVIEGGVWVFYPEYWEPIPAPIVVAPVAPVIVQPAPIVVQPAPVQYIEQPTPVAVQPSAPAQMDPHFWYYCRNPAGYYPYVPQCSGPWQKVPPTPR